jgi:hypothetical protein
MNRLLAPTISPTSPGPSSRSPWSGATSARSWSPSWHDLFIRVGDCDLEVIQSLDPHDQATIRVDGDPGDRTVVALGDAARVVLARTALGEVLVPTVAQFVNDERATETATAFHERLYDQIAAGDPELATVIARRHVEDFRAAWERSGLTYDRDVSELIDATATRLAPVPDAG